MNIEIASFDKMSPTGSSLIKLIQNEDLPKLDLFIRESVQNSLDAAHVGESGRKSVIVDVGIKEFSISDLAQYFEGISKSLIEKYGNLNNKLLYVEDKNTVGLTGPLDYHKVPIEERGNIFKLIYGISMPQSKEGSGGSWGLGKTIYFRLGIGLVIYYTRIEIEEDIYEHRLAATLVENEKGVDKIIPNELQELYRGISWWGKKVEDRTIPIIDEIEIEHLLSALNITMFKGKETGTKVIVPFIDEQDLLVQSTNPDFKGTSYTKDIEAYLKLALQRWYCPRLDNQDYQYGKWLDGRVNGVKISKVDMIPFYLELQRLYNSAAELSNLEMNCISKSSNAILREIELYYKFKQNNIGRVAFKKFSKKDLSMVAPFPIISPYALTNTSNESTNGNSPIILYTRRPGMIVGYETSGKWCQGVSSTEESEYIIGFFVPYSNVQFNVETEDFKTVEDYLRKTEKADHTSWVDIYINNEPNTIVKRIQEKTRAVIVESYSNTKKIDLGNSNTILSRKFGRLLLPPKGFGNRVTKGNNSGKVNRPSNPRNGAKKNNSLKITNQQYDSDRELIKVDFQIELSSKVVTAEVEIYIHSDSGKIYANDWESTDKGIGTAFPISLENIELDNFDGNTEKLSGEFLVTETFQKGFGLRIEKSNDKFTTLGSFEIKMDDPCLIYGLNLKLVEGQLDEK